MTAAQGQTPREALQLHNEALVTLDRHATELREARELLQRVAASQDTTQQLRDAARVLEEVRQTADVVKAAAHAQLAPPPAAPSAFRTLAASTAQGVGANGSGAAVSPWHDPPGSITYLTGMADQVTIPNFGPSVSLMEFSGADPTGATVSTSALRQAIAQALLAAEPGYAPARAAIVWVPAGRYALDGKIVLPDGVSIMGEGWGKTVFYLPSTTFADNCVFENQNLDFTQEFASLSGFQLYGQQAAGQVPTTNQPNPGVATTVATTISSPSTATFSLVAVGSLSAYASNGTLTVGAQRIKYQALDLANRTFLGCFITSGFGAPINAGDAITPVTTDNVSGIHWWGLAAPSFLDQLWVDEFTGSCIIAGSTNAVAYTNLVANHANRDCFLYTGSRPANTFRNIAGQYSDQAGSGNQFAGVHFLGQSGLQRFQGAQHLETIYSEQSSPNQIGLWLQNMGSVDVENFDMLGGSANFATQTGIQLDSSQVNPLTTDGNHSANVSIRNASIQQIGRVLLKDNIRGYSTPANATALGTAITRYDTEDHVSPRPYFSGPGKTAVTDADFGLIPPPNGVQAVHWDTTASRAYLSVRANGTWHVMAGPIA